MEEAGRRLRRKGQPALLADLEWDDHGTGDIGLILQDFTVIQAHRLKLGVSPVLRSILTSLDVRLDPRPHISLQEFCKEAVICLLTFIYRGKVVLVRNSAVLGEFMKLCRVLRLNPSITKSKRPGSHLEDSVQEMEGSKDQRVTEEDQEAAPEGICDQVLGSGEVLTDASESARIPDIYDGDLDLEICDSEAVLESDEETPEHISNFIHSLAPPSSHEAAEEALEDGVREEYTPFKMPDSFDIPAEYIKQMVPSQPAVNTVSNPFRTSDEETDKPASKVEEVASNEYTEVAKNATESIVDSERTICDQVVISTGDATSSELKVKAEVVEQLTYKKEASIRPRDFKKTKERKAHNPKMDRRTLQAKLFGESDSEGETKKEPEKRKKEPNCDQDQPKSDPKTDLEGKRKRIKKKLKQSDMEDKRSEKLKRKKKSHEGGRSSPHKSVRPSTPAKDHICNSSCACIKRTVNSEDESWLVPDTHVDYRSSSDSDARPVSRNKRLKKVNIGDSSTEEDEQEGADFEEAKKREVERKVALALRGGGDVLSRMRGRLSVSIQNVAKFVFLDLWQYTARLDESDSEAGSGTEARRSQKGDSDSSSEVSRGGKSSPSKQPSEEKRRHKKNKLKKLKIESPRSNVDFEVEDVEVWTPAMYQQWDKSGRPKEKKKKHKHDSDSRQKIKKPGGFQRSISFDTRKPVEPGGVALQRSASNLTSLEAMGIGHSFGPSSLAKLPKIPKLKKQENNL